MLSPLEQFEIIPRRPLRVGSFDLSFTNSSRRMVRTAGVLVIRAQLVFVNGHGLLVPTRLQLVLEGVQSIILSLIGQTIGPKGVVFYPFLFTVFTLILGFNLMGMVPYSFTVTSHLVVTITRALAILVGKLAIGLRRHGLKLFGMFLPAGTPFAMYLFMVPLEMLGFFITFISLSVRLFANMMSGHVLLKVIAGFALSMMAAGGIMLVAHLIPRGVVFLLMFLETAVAFIQAYVFTRRTAIYLTDMVHGGH